MKKLETQLLADFYMVLAFKAWANDQHDLGHEYIAIANQLMREP